MTDLEFNPTALEIEVVDEIVVAPNGIVQFDEEEFTG